jgi:hypothetical protein
MAPEFFSAEHEGVTVGDEDLLDLGPERRSRGVEILERLGESTQAERLVAVHVAGGR